jgi:hypothetical protein
MMGSMGIELAGDIQDGAFCYSTLWEVLVRMQ